MLALVLLGAGFVAGRFGRIAPHALPEKSALLKNGPWGEIEFVPMSICAPEELLPVRAFESEGAHWFFKGYTFEAFADFLDMLDLPEELREQLLRAPVLELAADGVRISPTPEILFALPEKSRSEIYRRVAQFSENSAQFTCLHTATLSDRFRENNVSSATVALFEKLSCPYGEYTIFYGMSALLSSLPDYAEKVRFLKALTQQKTMLLKLHITPDTDINALTAYWGKAVWNTDVKAMLESVSKIPGGTWIDLVELLPPLPTSLLYTFPIPDNPLVGPPIRRDCHWTAFNFFRDPPDPHFSEPGYVLENLKLNYFPVISDPRYGDLVLFTRPDGTLIHSAVFLADEVVYTKNGDTPIHPWMLATIPDLVRQYSFQIAPTEKLNVQFFRSKSY